MKVGYARVSTETQDLEIQIDTLKQAGCEKIFVEKESGMKNNRRELSACLAYLQKGDVLIIRDLSRINRDAAHFAQIEKYLDENGIELRSLTEQLDTKTPHGKFVIRTLANVNQLERDRISCTTKAKLAFLKAQGVKLGRPAKLKNKEEKKVVLDCYFIQKWSRAKIHKIFKIAPRTLSYYARQARDEGLYLE